jgi:hypothetical protein
MSSTQLFFGVKAFAKTQIFLKVVSGKMLRPHRSSILEKTTVLTGFGAGGIISYRNFASAKR